MYAGIDPGKSGAIVIINDAGKLVAVYDMPIAADLVDPVALLEILREQPIEYAALERPGTYGEHPNALFSLGTSFGIACACLVMTGVQVLLASPAAWKNRMLVTKDKATSIERARHALPDLPLFKSTRCTVLSHDRAEAGLLALYVRAVSAALHHASPKADAR